MRKNCAGIMQIANLQLKNPVVLAPMAGITDLPYRRLMKRFGAGLVFTEMVSANGLMRSGRGSRDLLVSVPEERPLGVQLFGDAPPVLADAARIVEEEADLIDLNLGCPVNKVVRSGAGSALLRTPSRVAAIVRAVRASTSRPLSVKIRSGWDAQSVNFIEIARIAVAEGADAITLHPRTRSQGFGGKADWELIRQLKSKVDVPVIGSGDIFAPQDALDMQSHTGCDGVMIGRGGYGNPWLIQDILRLRQGLAIAPSGPREREEVARLHLDLFLEVFPERKAVRDLRKHLAWYSRGLPGAADFRSRVNQVQSTAEMRVLLESYFAEAAAAVEAA